MKVLLFITGFRHVKEYDYFNKFLQRLNTLSHICDVFIYCNNPAISDDILAYYKQFKQTNKHLYVTSLNAGFGMGAVQAVSSGIEMGVFKDYDYVIHLHPDVFITDDSTLIKVLYDNVDNDCVFFVTKSIPDDERFFSFDFFVFKPKLLKVNIFRDALSSNYHLPEHYLCDMILKNSLPFKMLKRFENDQWFPRRVDEHLKLYHEHDLRLVEELLTAGTAKAAEPPGGQARRWQPAVVELLPLIPIKH